MALLIDGHNLIGRMPSLSLRDPHDEARLIALLKSYRARTGKAVTVVFDPGGAYAPAGRRQEGGVEVIFARQGRSADDLILRRVRESRDRRKWLVITSDRRLADSVGRLGARVQPAEDFAAHLQPTPDEDETAWKDVVLSPAEIEDWLALFKAEADSHDDENAR